MFPGDEESQEECLREKGLGGGGEMGGNPVLCVTSGIITVYRQCQFYHSPCARDKNSKLQCLLLSLYTFGSPVKLLSPLLGKRVALL